MFLQHENIILKSKTENQLPGDRLVIGIENKGEAKAYPIQFLAYHHQIQDSIGGEAVIVTYCNVCRTGRVFEPVVNGHYEKFRLVGMDHFNAMFEDQKTKSWWRQVSGESIAGPLKGAVLPELLSEQTTLKQWIALHPETLIMQPDSTFTEEYESLDDYDFGTERGKLTRTDTLSWMDKSWVVGIEVGTSSKAIDWNQLKKERVVNFTLSGKPIFVVLAPDDLSFFAFERPADASFVLENDTLISGGEKYSLLGHPVSAGVLPLKPVKAYQEFWHSWKTFHGDAR